MSLIPAVWLVLLAVLGSTSTRLINFGGLKDFFKRDKPSEFEYGFPGTPQYSYGSYSSQNMNANSGSYSYQSGASLYPDYLGSNQYLQYPDDSLSPYGQMLPSQFNMGTGYGVGGLNSGFKFGIPGGNYGGMLSNPSGYFNRYGTYNHPRNSYMSQDWDFYRQNRMFDQGSDIAALGTTFGGFGAL